MSETADHKKPVKKAAEPAADHEKGHEKGGEKRFLSADIQRWSWEKIKGITGGIAKRAKAVVSATWGATGGQIGAELGEIATMVGLPAGKEKGLFGPIASIIGSTGRGVKNVFRGLGIGIGHVAATPLRVGERAVRGVGGVLSGAWSGEMPKAANDNRPVAGHGEDEGRALAA